MLDYLVASPAVSCCGIFGRSMGATTAVLVAGDVRYRGKVKCLVLDSVYSSISEVRCRAHAPREARSPCLAELLDLHQKLTPVY